MIHGTTTQEEIFLRMKETKNGKPVPFTINAYQKCARSRKTGGEITSFEGFIWAKMLKKAPKLAKINQNKSHERWRTAPITLYHPVSGIFREIYPEMILVFENKKVID